MSDWRHLPVTLSAADACAWLCDLGWRQVGAGDWAWALADPADELVARVTPYDPGYRAFAEDCLRGPPNRWLPRVEAILPLAREGYVVIMQRLWPAPEAVASAFCASLDIPNTTHHAPPVPGPFDGQDHPDLAALRDRMLVLIADGVASHPFWACDIHEGNVMADADGRLKLIDPVGIAGWKISAALAEGHKDQLADFSRAQLEDFLDIPFFGAGREGAEPRDALLAQVHRLYGDVAPG